MDFSRRSGLSWRSVLLVRCHTEKPTTFHPGANASIPSPNSIELGISSDQARGDSFEGSFWRGIFLGLRPPPEKVLGVGVWGSKYLLRRWSPRVYTCQSHRLSLTVLFIFGSSICSTDALLHAGGLVSSVATEMSGWWTALKQLKEMQGSNRKH